MNLLTTKEAAERLGLSEQRVRALIGNGQLKATSFGRSHVIRECDLAKVEKRATAGRPPKVEPKAKGKKKNK